MICPSNSGLGCCQRQYVLPMLSAAERVNCIVLPKGIDMQQTDVERRFLGQGQAVMY